MHKSSECLPPCTEFRLLRCYDDQVMSPPKELNSELIGLLSHKKECTSKVHKQTSQKIKDSHMRALPDHIKHYKHVAMVTKNRSASNASNDSTFKEVWSKRRRYMVFGSYFNPLATKFPGFSVCHPHYDDSVMLNMENHAICSFLSAESVPFQLFCSSQIGRA